MLGIWREHFSALLVPDETNADEAITQYEVRIAVARLKNNKAAELLKTGGDELIGRMHQLICKIWLDERMPADWNLNGDHMY